MRIPMHTGKLYDEKWMQICSALTYYLSNYLSNEKDVKWMITWNFLKAGNIRCLCDWIKYHMKMKCKINNKL